MTRGDSPERLTGRGSGRTVQTQPSSRRDSGRVSACHNDVVAVPCADAVRYAILDTGCVAIRWLRLLVSRSRVVGVASENGSVQDAIRAHRWLLDAILEQFPDGAVNVFDRELRFLDVAGTGLLRIGLRSEQLIGHRLDELFPEIVAWVRPFFDRAFAGETVTFPLSVVGREYGIRAWPLAETAGAITAVVAIAREAPARPAAAEELTPRQREIAMLVAAGLTNNQIAERLMLAPRTVRNYVGHILHRLDFVSRTQVAVWAAACGLYSPEEGDGVRLDGDRLDNAHEVGGDGNALPPG
jgi:DNA-binding CsgD family transcriptional regulator